MAVKDILNYLREGEDCYPSPEKLYEYLEFDDWTIYSALKKKLGGEHGDIVLNRKHYKCIFKSQMIPTLEDEENIMKLKERYKDVKLYYLDDKASTLWYKLDKDISIYGNGRLQPLSEKSVIVKAMGEKTVQKRFYVKKESL